MIQLAIRSGQYQTLNASEVKKGELVSYNPITSEVELSPIMDPEARESAPTIGYYASFTLTNGFKKEIYWPKEKMEHHATQYSAGYRAHKGYTFWEKDFDSMAKKTMLRQLISKWGVMSIEMQTAYVNDMAEVKADGGFFEPENYPDNDTDRAKKAAPVEKAAPEEPAEPEEVDLDEF